MLGVVLCKILQEVWTFSVICDIIKMWEVSHGIYQKRESFKWERILAHKPGMYPMPVLIVGTYEWKWKAGRYECCMGGIYETNQIMLCLSASHRTTKNIKEKGAFTVSFATAKTVVPSDYVGIVSATTHRTRWKIRTSRRKSTLVDAPLFQEYPMTLECKLVKFNEDGYCSWWNR